MQGALVGEVGSVFATTGTQHGGQETKRIVSAIVDGVALHDLTVTSLARRLAYSWVEQKN